MKQAKIGILLINLGTPDAPTTSAIQKYLREFLLDKRVIDLPFPLRQMLVCGFILPFRAPRTTKLYQKIWTTEGSPLLVHSKSLQAALQKKLGEDYLVEMGMRYGSPSIQTAYEKLKAVCNEIKVLPLFPQYTSTTTGSALENFFSLVKKENIIPSLEIISHFYNHPAYIESLAGVAKPMLDTFKPDFLLMSYHGLPEREVKKIAAGSDLHYRAQCETTSKLLGEKLQLPSPQCTTSFQSRLGRIPWIKPYTNEILPELYQKGVRRLAIICPSFVADCLETLEEIGIRAREQWQALGGEDFCLVPSLNTKETWLEACVIMLSNEQRRP